MWKNVMESVSAGMSSPAPGWSVLSSQAYDASRSWLTDLVGSFATRGAHWSSVHASQGEAGIATAPIRTSHLQTAMSFSAEPFLVSRWPLELLRMTMLTDY